MPRIQWSKKNNLFKGRMSKSKELRASIQENGDIVVVDVVVDVVAVGEINKER